MDEKRVREMQELQKKTNRTPEEDDRLRQLLGDYLDEVGFGYPHETK